MIHEVKEIKPPSHKSDNLECLEIVKTLIESDALQLKGMVVIGPDSEGEIFCYCSDQVTATDAIVLGEFLKFVNLVEIADD